ncbi:MAG: hypothetical protein ACK55Z_19630 [bacterium]
MEEGAGRMIDYLQCKMMEANMHTHRPSLRRPSTNPEKHSRL